LTESGFIGDSIATVTSACFTNQNTSNSILDILQTLGNDTGIRLSQ